MIKTKLEVVAGAEITIDKNVPMAASHGNTKYPWTRMEVGDSFVIPSNSGYQLALRASQTHAPKKFQAKMQAGVIRCWRVE